MTETTSSTTITTKILVADDDAVIRKFFRKVLEHQGYAVLEAENGNDALSVLDGNDDIDLVITDVHMPHLSGIDLLTEIQKYASKIPVIIITGKASVEAAVECMKIGAVDFISKPCSLDTIRETVVRALEKTKIEGDDPLDGTQTVMLREHLDFLAGYNIIGRLGEGNMGIVFLVEKTAVVSDERFALKIMKSFDCSEDERLELRERFFREADAASRVLHPNIVRIEEYGEDCDAMVIFIVMEYCEGNTLDWYISRHKNYDFRQKAYVIHQIADALSAIHEINIYHRDIKPGNIIIDDDLNVKITDFGIAKVPESSLTQQSDLMGSPGYMSPESFISSDIDNRSDIFSLGVLAYELFIGKRPFVAETIHRMCHVIQHDEAPDPRESNPEFPEPLIAILDKMLQKKRENRYSAVAEVAKDLKVFIDSHVHIDDV